MGSRQSDFQRQRSALLLIDPPPRSNNDPSPRHNDTFISSSSFPVFGPIFNFDIMQHSKHTNTQRSTAQQERIHFSKAKPHCQILTPFPLWLDKRFIDQEKADLTEKHKSKQKTPSEDVRCFWALASTRLSECQGRFDVANFAFLHFDPTLEESLGYSVDSLIGTSILDFMHPNEATEIGLKILQYVLGENIGSAVFRCTMKSVASLGRYVHSTQDDLRSDFSTFARSLKSDQQLTDIRLELIGDDMLLCFFHAVEKRSIHDDDQREKSQWSDCCYTSLDIFSDQHCQSLWQHVFAKRLIELSSSSIQRHLTGFPRSIFQILTNGTTSSKILFSWPPPRLFDSASCHSDSSGTESYNDGSYFADDLARSAIETKFGEENLGMNQFVTACARRQIREGKITADGVAIKFKVTLIPLGDIKFAIFSISRADYINQEAGHNSSRGDQIFPVTFTPNRQSQPSTIANPEQQKQSSFSQTPPGLTFSKSIFSLPSMAAAPNAFTSRTPQTFNILPATGMMVDDKMREPGRRLSARVKTITSQGPSLFPMNDDKLYQHQPIQTRSGPRPNEGQITPFYFPIHRSGPHPNTFPESPTKSCLVCKASKSPEWRKGPDGNKSLCNACGLPFSRNASRVKKKEEKARNAAEVIENGGVVPEQLRRKLEAERGKKKGMGCRNSLKNTHFNKQLKWVQPILTGSANFSPDLDV